VVLTFYLLRGASGTADSIYQTFKFAEFNFLFNVLRTNRYSLQAHIHTARLGSSRSRRKDSRGADKVRKNGGNDSARWTCSQSPGRLPLKCTDTSGSTAHGFPARHRPERIRPSNALPLHDTLGRPGHLVQPVFFDVAMRLMLFDSDAVIARIRDRLLFGARLQSTWGPPCLLPRAFKEPVP